MNRVIFIAIAAGFTLLLSAFLVLPTGTPIRELVGLAEMFVINVVPLCIIAGAFWATSGKQTITWLFIVEGAAIALASWLAWGAFFHTPVAGQDCHPSYDKQGIYSDC